MRYLFAVEKRFSPAVAAGGLPERRHGCPVALQPPVLVMWARMLVHVKPDHSQQAVTADAPEEVGNLPRLVVRELAGRGLGDQHGLPGDLTDDLERGAEDITEIIGWPCVVAIHADPRHVLPAGPVGAEGGHVCPDRMDRPEPGDVVCMLVPEDIDDMPPGFAEIAWLGIALSPGIPVAVHLMGEADDNRVAEGTDFVSERS